MGDKLLTPTLPDPSNTVTPKVYGFHINQNEVENDPTGCVTYLEDAIGMTPAYYDSNAGKVNLGSWENREDFLRTKSCMLNYDGTVAYYLDSNDETKKEDGTPSDVANPEFPGNAMVEWNQIWYKFVNDTDGNGVSVYVSDSQLDENYVAWSCYDANNNLQDHFYRPKYSATMIDGTLRSLSGFAPISNTEESSIDVMAEIAGATKNNTLGNLEGNRWYTETYSDYILEWILLVLFGKTLNIQSVFGLGYSHSHVDTHAINSGTANGRGDFSGDIGGEEVSKVFGMENTWGNQFRRIAGLTTDSEFRQLVKLTPNTADGSSASSYNTDGTGYLQGHKFDNSIMGDNIGIKELEFDERGFYTIADTFTPANTSKYYCTNTYIDGGRYAYIGGHYASGSTPSPLYIFLSSRITSKHDYIGTSISFR